MINYQLYPRVVDKLEAAGLKEKRHIGGASGTRRKKEKPFPEGILAPSATDRRLLQPADDGAIPVEVGYLCVAKVHSIECTPGVEPH